MIPANYEGATDEDDFVMREREEEETVKFHTVPVAKADTLRRKVTAQFRVRCKIDACATDRLAEKGVENLARFYNKRLREKRRNGDK